MAEAFERDAAFVLEALNRGEFDYVEIVGAVEETRFFRLLLGEGVLQRLAAGYPTPRQKEEVPLWLYLASELTLRLHGARGFGAYPYILHCGGLLQALGPERVTPRQDETGQWRMEVQGYNQKNDYARTTPCDKDTLRKLAKDTSAGALEDWYGTAVVREYQAMGGFDKEGVFVADGTYLFVPLDNDRYENSTVLRVDAHGHPVGKEEYEKLSPREQKRCVWRRCYRMVGLSHLGENYSLRCGMHVVPGNAAEAPQVRPLVERFVQAVGPGVMKLLLFDRGLIDGATVGALKELGVDSLFPLKKGMDLWTNAQHLAEANMLTWQRYEIPPPPPPPPPPAERPQHILLREEKRRQTLAAKAPAAAPHRLVAIEYAYVEPGQVWDTCPVPVGVLLVRNHYADGETRHWALATTRRFDDPLQMWQTYRRRGGVEEDHRQEKCFWDLAHFRTPDFDLVVNRVVFVEMAYSLIQIFLLKIQKQELVGQARERLLDALLPQKSHVIVYYQNRYTTLGIYQYQEILLELQEGARRKALGKTRQLRRAQLMPPVLPWQPV
jgi:hypothetical protein